MRILFILFLVVSATFTTFAQTSSSGAYSFTQAAYNPLDGAQKVGEITALGEAFPVYQTPNGKTFAHLRGKYFVWSSFTPVDNLPDGTEVYTSPSGTPFIFTRGNKGIYAKYGKKNDN